MPMYFNTTSVIVQFEKAAKNQEIEDFNTTSVIVQSPINAIIDIINGNFNTTSVIVQSYLLCTKSTSCSISIQHLLLFNSCSCF